MKLTYANITSTIALFLALGTGGAFAANAVAPGAIWSRHIRDGQITQLDLHPSVRAKLNQSAPSVPQTPSEGSSPAPAPLTASRQGLLAYCFDGGCEKDLITFVIPKDRSASSFTITGELAVDPYFVQHSEELVLSTNFHGTQLIDGDGEPQSVGPTCHAPLNADKTIATVNCTVKSTWTKIPLGQYSVALTSGAISSNPSSEVVKYLEVRGPIKVTVN